MESMLLIKRRTAIIIATIDAINECGIQAISTKEIAKKQGISETVIFKHFPTKNELLSAVLDYFAKYDDAILETVESKGMGPLVAVKYFFDSYSTYYENYPAITAITQSFDALQTNSELGSKVRDIFEKHEFFIRHKLMEAQSQKLINPNTDAESMADIILGAFMRLCLKWRMKDYKFSLRQKTLYTIQSLLESFNK